MDSETEQNFKKKIKTEIGNHIAKGKPLSTKTKSSEKYAKAGRCSLCKQYLDVLLYYSGHPNYSTDEPNALSDEKLNIFTGNEECINEDDHPTHKVTLFTIYDENNHLCAFDNGLVESNVKLYFSGYIKPIFDEDPSSDNGIAAHDIGPINEWWMAGYDGGEKLPIGFTTDYAYYYLMEPSPEYEPLFREVKEKTKLAKLVVEFLFDCGNRNPQLEELLDHLESTGEFSNVIDKLIQHAQFICDQLVSIDQNAEVQEEDDPPLCTYSCIISLIQRAGVSFKKRSGKIIKVTGRKKVNVMSKAVTTKLVQDVFGHFFPDQMDSKGDKKGSRKKRCGICEACQSPDCGKCNNCLDMLKFGGSGKCKQACKHRRCMNAEIAGELSDNEVETDSKANKKTQVVHVSKKVIHNVKWKEQASTKYKGYQCYLSAEIGGKFTVKVGDFVALKPEKEKDPLCIAKIIYMYDRLPQKNVFHGHIFCRGTDSILGETADPRELFVIDDCKELLLGSVLRKATVNYRKIPDDWFRLGGELGLEEPLQDDGEHFFFTKRLENNRFIDLDFNPEDYVEGCDSCRRQAIEKQFNTPTFVKNCIKWRNEDYEVGMGVFLEPDVYVFKNGNEITEDNKENYADEIIYPEYYRKTENVKGSNKDTPPPFVIGIIEDILETKQKDIQIKVKIFFRPENTYGSIFSAYTKDLNYLYYSNKEITVSFEKVEGKCYLTYGYNLEDPSEWAEEGPFRFYFTEAYDPVKNQVVNLPTHAKNIGISGKGKGKRKTEISKLGPVWDVIPKPLRCMDLFAGCGGLSEGLKQSGAAESKWAIENHIPAANAFKLNNPNCKVVTGDCNELLKLILNNEGKIKGLPEKGEVEMLVGGPPCQGFSGMNRFNSRNYSSFKNSLVATCLSYCEYYRPKYFIMENVRNFVSFNKNMVLKLTLRCLLAMGYQVAFGILQAGQYGVPQTRIRFILMAAAPGCVLPTYPEPLHVFSRKATRLTFVADGYLYNNESFWTESAPFRTITVRDALCDLPEIKNGSMCPKIPYISDPITHFQRKMRGPGDNANVCDHICKDMSTLVLARISHIPSYPGADWRDLPNIRLKLTDGTITNILQYAYKTKKQKSTDPPKGVCLCASKGIGSCDSADKQSNTLIPWCLPHTGDRHNNWAGLYGRVEWDNYFGTTITNPEPMGKQGRVLHPEQHRVVSVRECARSQGFPDTVRFCGTILEKYRQIGNAVPPPLGCAIGREIVKALNKSLKEL